MLAQLTANTQMQHLSFCTWQRTPAITCALHWPTSKGCGGRAQRLQQEISAAPLRGCIARFNLKSIIKSNLWGGLQGEVYLPFPSTGQPQTDAPRGRPPRDPRKTRTRQPKRQELSPSGSSCAVARRPQDAPRRHKTPQEPPQNSQRPLKSPPDPPRAPKSSQDPPRSPQDAPSCPQEAII